MESASAPQPSECGTGNQAKDAFVLVFRQQVHVPLGQKPAPNLENWRSHKVLASNDSDDTDATHIALGNWYNGPPPFGKTAPPQIDKMAPPLKSAPVFRKQLTHIKLPFT